MKRRADFVADQATERALARDLLAFAIQRIARETSDWSDSYRNPFSGKIEDESIAIEIRDNRVWLRRARAYVRLRKPAKRAIARKAVRR